MRTYLLEPRGRPLNARLAAQSATDDSRLTR